MISILFDQLNRSLIIDRIRMISKKKNCIEYHTKSLLSSPEINISNLHLSKDKKYYYHQDQHVKNPLKCDIENMVHKIANKFCSDYAK